MNKTLIIVLAVIVVIGGFFLFFGKSNAPVIDNKTTSAGTETTNPKVNGVPVSAGAQMETGTVTTVTTTVVNTAKKVTVNYTDNGFSPKTITIKKGDSVTFINGSSGGMSVASDPHPTHTNYPEFDQYKSPEKGQKSYTFVFGKVGSWGYHNHLNPSMTGTVVVE